MSDAVFKTLECIDTRDIHAAFLSAFSDYSVAVDMPYEKFTIFLKANGFEPSLSAGAFVDGRLCGFILNGIRLRQGVLTAYDGGTGVVPACRRQGFTKHMFTFCLPLLQSAGVSRYVLEVIQDNEPALRFYRSFGFSIARGLICCRAGKDKLGGDCTAARIVDVGGLDIDATEFWDYSPTWQNTLDSINAVPEQCAAAVIEVGGRTAGYGIINRKSGRVYQLAVKRDCRGRGAGSQLFYKLAEQTAAENIAFLNVDGGCAGMLGFLKNHGFEEYVRQYEMTLDI